MDHLTARLPKQWTQSAPSDASNSSASEPKRLSFSALTLMKRVGPQRISAVLCLWCDGRGRQGDYNCIACAGEGVVCPTCHGLRFVRTPAASGNQIERCLRCLDRVNETTTLQRWTARQEQLNAQEQEMSS